MTISTKKKGHGNILHITEYVCVTVSIISLILIVFTHIYLIKAGQWGVDEYIIFTSFRNGGYATFLDFLIQWSPRPFSNGLLYLYSLVVTWFHAPLVGAFLALCWMLLIGSTLIGASFYWRAFTTSGQWIFPYRILLSLSLLAMFLLGHSIQEVFYWPMGAAPYLVTLAAITFFFFQLVQVEQPRLSDKIIRIVALLAAAGSSEIGALFVLCYSILTLPVLESVPNKKLHWLFWSLPLLLSSLVLAILFFHRVGAPEFVHTDTDIVHNLVASTEEGSAQFFIDLFDPGDLKEWVETPLFREPYMDGSILGILEGVVVKILFFLGFRGCWSMCGKLHHPSRPFLLFGLALLLACWGSIIAAEYQFGRICCSRHETLRQCFIVLALAAIAVASLGNPVSFLPKNHRGIIVPLLLLMPAIFLFLQRWPNLREDYSNYSRFIITRDKTWQSGLRHDKSDMIFYLTPKANVISDTRYMNDYNGAYRLDDRDLASNIRSVLQFFDKQTICITSSLPDVDACP